jgi:hypothetical protein
VSIRGAKGESKGGGWATTLARGERMELSEEVVAQLLADQHHDHQESIEQEKEQEHLRECALPKNTILD